MNIPEKFRLLTVKRAAALVLAGLALAAGAAPASAQFFFNSWRAPIYAPRPFYGPGPYAERYGLRAGEVHRMLAEDGYDVIGVYRNGRVFVADVVGPRGRDRLIVDGASGRIVQSFATGRRQTARLVPPGEIEPRALPRYREAEPDAVVRRPRASAPPRVQPQPKARASVPARPVPSYAARPAPSARPAAPAAPQPPASEAVKAAPIETAPAAAPPAAPPARTAQPTNDVPVAPLDDATPRRAPRTPVNDVPVAPLD